MTQVTIEFPQAVAHDIEQQGVTQEVLQKLIIRFVQHYVKEAKKHSSEKQSWSDGSDFATFMISNNRELFEELAKL